MPAKRYTCLVCGKTWKRKNDLSRHLNKANLINGEGVNNHLDVVMHRIQYKPVTRKELEQLARRFGIKKF